MVSFTVAEKRSPANLCSICKTIPFDGLILPYVAETDNNPQDDNTEVSGFYDMGTERTMTKVKFGMMSRVFRNADNCDFCAIIGGILRTHPTSPFGPQDSVMWDETGRPHYENAAIQQDRPCEIKLMWFVGIKHPRIPRMGRWSGRLFVNWKDDLGVYHGAYSCFQTLDQHIGELESSPKLGDPFDHQLLCGGRRRPLDVDLDWIREWMKICVREHTSECSLPIQTLSQPTARIRLIDVNRMCLVDNIALNELSRNFKYMALSYVWGNLPISEGLTLLSSNKNSLTQTHSFDLNDLPPTFSDFIQLARSLPIPYVWVDALCIVQDDREDVMSQIAAMSAIYQHAFVTVVAADGDNVHSGLAGLRPGTRRKVPKQITIRLSDLDRKNKDGNCDYITLIETTNPPEHTNWTPLTSTAWNSRAWTYQERLLSRRTLIFTKEQLYWACNEASFCEETVMEFSQEKITHHPGYVNPIQASFHTTFKSEFLDSGNSTQTMPDVWKAYKEFVAHYSRRKLSYEGDVHAAFAGILQAMAQRSGDEFLMGHPRSRFECGLAWENFGIIRRRTDRSNFLLAINGESMTMPSWSWMGWQGEVLFNVTLEKELDGARPQVECFTHRTSPLRLVPARAHAESEISAQKTDWVYVSQECPTLEEIAIAHPQLARSALEQEPDETVIFFWASACRLHVKYPAVSNRGVQPATVQRTVPNPTILDANGAVIGELQCVERSLDREPDGMFEFVVISRHSAADPEMAQVLGDKVHLKILQIGWRLDEQGNRGLCKERMNIGTIDELDWIKAGPQRRLIALQ